MKQLMLGLSPGSKEASVRKIRFAEAPAGLHLDDLF